MNKEEAIKIVKSHYPANKQMLNEALEFLIPELKEKTDKEMIQKLISVVHLYYGDGVDTERDECLEWLEKQSKKFIKTNVCTVDLSNCSEEYRKAYYDGYNKCSRDLFENLGEIDKESYEIAEKRKHDFVSGQFIECRKSFDVFKEDNSYWLEYVGNDNYVGRSDNILNQKFHITPRQLYSLFTQQHCPKENNINEETNAPTEYGKYIDRYLNEAAKHFFSEGEDKYSVADLFYAGVKCGENVVELYGKTVKEENENKPIERKEFTSIPFGAFDSELYESMITIPDGCVATIEGNKVHIKREGKSAIEANKEEKVNNVNKIELKVKVGDYVVRKDGKNFHNNKKFAQIIKIDTTMYQVDYGNWLYNDEIRPWTINDAEPGDVLVCPKYAGDIIPNIFIFKDIDINNNVYCYCSFLKIFFATGGYIANADPINTNFYPATKEQCNLLFQKVEESGYEWNVDKKELKKLN